MLDIYIDLGYDKSKYDEPRLELSYGSAYTEKKKKENWFRNTDM